MNTHPENLHKKCTLVDRIAENLLSGADLTASVFARDIEDIINDGDMARTLEEYAEQLLCSSASSSAVDPAEHSQPLYGSHFPQLTMQDVDILRMTYSFKIVDVATDKASSSAVALDCDDFVAEPSATGAKTNTVEEDMYLDSIRSFFSEFGSSSSMDAIRRRAKARFWLKLLQQQEKKKKIAISASKSGNEEGFGAKIKKEATVEELQKLNHKHRGRPFGSRIINGKLVRLEQAVHLDPSSLPKPGNCGIKRTKIKNSTENQDTNVEQIEESPPDPSGAEEKTRKKRKYVRSNKFSKAAREHRRESALARVVGMPLPSGGSEIPHDGIVDLPMKSVTTSGVPKRPKPGMQLPDSFTALKDAAVGSYIALEASQPPNKPVIYPAHSTMPLFSSFQWARARGCACVIQSSHKTKKTAVVNTVVHPIDIVSTLVSELSALGGMSKFGCEPALSASELSKITVHFSGKSDMSLSLLQVIEAVLQGGTALFDLVQETKQGVSASSDAVEVTISRGRNSVGGSARAASTIASEYLNALEEHTKSVNLQYAAAKKDCADRTAKRWESLLAFRRCIAAQSGNGSTAGRHGLGGGRLAKGITVQDAMMEAVPVFMDRVLNPFLAHSPAEFHCDPEDSGEGSSKQHQNSNSWNWFCNKFDDGYVTPSSYDEIYWKCETMLPKSGQEQLDRSFRLSEAGAAVLAERSLRNLAEYLLAVKEVEETRPASISSSSALVVASDRLTSLLSAPHSASAILVDQTESLAAIMPSSSTDDGVSLNADEKVVHRSSIVGSVISRFFGRSPSESPVTCKSAVLENWGPVLVVCKSLDISAWQASLNAFCANRSLQVVVYGDSESRRSKLRSFLRASASTPSSDGLSSTGVGVGAHCGGLYSSRSNVHVVIVSYEILMLDLHYLTGTVSGLSGTSNGAVGGPDGSRDRDREREPLLWQLVCFDQPWGFFSNATYVYSGAVQMVHALLCSSRSRLFTCDSLEQQTSMGDVTVLPSIYETLSVVCPTALGIIPSHTVQSGTGFNTDSSGMGSSGSVSGSAGTTSSGAAAGGRSHVAEAFSHLAASPLAHYWTATASSPVESTPNAADPVQSIADSEVGFDGKTNELFLKLLASLTAVSDENLASHCAAHSCPSVYTESNEVRAVCAWSGVRVSLGTREQSALHFSVGKCSSQLVAKQTMFSNRFCDSVIDAELLNVNLGLVGYSSLPAGASRYMDCRDIRTLSASIRKIASLATTKCQRFLQAIPNRSNLMITQAGAIRQKPGPKKGSKKPPKSSGGVQQACDISTSGTVVAPLHHQTSQGDVDGLVENKSITQRIEAIDGVKQNNATALPTKIVGSVSIDAESDPSNDSDDQSDSGEEEDDDEEEEGAEEQEQNSAEDYALDKNRLLVDSSDSFGGRGGIEVENSSVNHERGRSSDSEDGSDDLTGDSDSGSDDDCDDSQASSIIIEQPSTIVNVLQSDSEQSDLDSGSDEDDEDGEDSNDDMGLGVKRRVSGNSMEGEEAMSPSKRFRPDCDGDDEDVTDDNSDNHGDDDEEEEDEDNDDLEKEGDEEDAEVEVDCDNQDSFDERVPCAPLELSFDFRVLPSPRAGSDAAPDTGPFSTVPNRKQIADLICKHGKFWFVHVPPAAQNLRDAADFQAATDNVATKKSRTLRSIHRKNAYNAKMLANRNIFVGKYYSEQEATEALALALQYRDSVDRQQRAKFDELVAQTIPLLTSKGIVDPVEAAVMVGANLAVLDKPQELYHLGRLTEIAPRRNLTYKGQLIHKYMKDGAFIDPQYYEKLSDDDIRSEIVNMTKLQSQVGALPHEWTREAVRGPPAYATLRGYSKRIRTGHDEAEEVYFRQVEVPILHISTVLGRDTSPAAKGNDISFFSYRSLIDSLCEKEAEPLTFVSTNRSVAREHARLSWNAVHAYFEISALATDGSASLFVNGKVHTIADGPLPVFSRDVLQLGSEFFMFLLPKDTRSEASLHSYKAGIARNLAHSVRFRDKGLQLEYFAAEAERRAIVTAADAATATAAVVAAAELSGEAVEVK